MIKLNVVSLSCFSQLVIRAFIVAGMLVAILAAYLYKLITATFSAFVLYWYDYTTLILKSFIRLYIEFKR